MAQYFLGLNRGQQKPSNVSVGTSAPSADVYLQILTTNAPTKEDVALALNVLRQYILSNGIPSGEAGTDLPVL